ncbi:MAG: hypothetical protein J3R72DRAFT_522518 [Linnemannia gamsii]|nr:MAG: hypothetical protein J3R72DRAFT_522518 [Linnemannia gamsii]
MPDQPVQPPPCSEPARPSMSRVESLYDAYPTSTTQPFAISPASPPSNNNVAMGSMVGCIFAVMALTVVGVLVVKRMKRRPTELRDVESLGYKSHRPMEKVADDATSRP